MKENSNQLTGDRILLAVASFVIVVAGMRAAEPILIPFLLSTFIAIISGPLLYWLHEKGIPIGAALVIVMAGILGVGFLLAALIGTSINDFSNSLPEYQASLNDKKTALLAWLTGRGITISSQGLLEHFDPGAAMSLVATTLGGLGKLFTNAFLILLTVIFILLEGSSIPKKLRAMSNDPDASVRSFDAFTENVKRYMAIKTLVSMMTGAIIAVWLAVIGVDYALLWGVLAFVLNFVPNIGSIIAAIPAILLALVQLGVGPALVSGLGYVLVNIVVGNVIEPRFMGKGLGLSTLVVFLSLVFWGWVLGPVGMLLSVPLTMTVKIALDSREDTRWLAILLGTEAAADDALNTDASDPDSEPA